MKYRIPSCANIPTLEEERQDLLVYVDVDGLEVPILDPDVVLFTLPAPGYATDPIPFVEDEEEGQSEGQMEEEKVQPGVRRQLSALDSMDDLSQSLSDVTRADEDRMDADDLFSDDGSHVSIDLDVIPRFHDLPVIFRNGLLATADGLANVSEHDRTYGWMWMELEEARDWRHGAQPPPIKRNGPAPAEKEVPPHFSLWIWGRRPLDGSTGGEDGAREPLRDITHPPGCVLVVPGDKNEYYRQDGHNIESHETKWKCADLALLCLLVPPGFGLTERDMNDMTQSQEVSCCAPGS